MELTRVDLVAALKALDRQLGERGTSAELRIVGGAAMALRYEKRRTTDDVDALFTNYPEVRAAIEATADELGLPHDWVNSQIHDLALPFEADSGAERLRIGEHLSLRLPSAEFLLFTKVTSTRRSNSDIRDALTLIRHLGLRDEQSIEKAISRFGRIDGATELFIEALAAELQSDP